MVLPTSPLMGSAPRFEYPKQGERRPLPRFARTSSARARLGCFFRLRALIECRLGRSVVAGGRVVVQPSALEAKHGGCLRLHRGGLGGNVHVLCGE